MKLNKRSKVFIIVGSLLVFIFVSGLIGGCSSSVLAPALTTEEQALVESIHFNYVIGVDESGANVYSDRLISSLRNTGLFKEVNYINKLKLKPEFIAKANNRVYGSAVIPIVTAITLGFFPTWVEENHGNSFSLQMIDNPDSVININSVYGGYTFLGWISGILNILPDRTSGNPVEHSRYTKRLAYDIITSLN